MTTSTLERRVEALEAPTGGDGGCDRCRGLLVIVSNAISGEFHSASWSGEVLSEDDRLRLAAIEPLGIGGHTS